MNVDEGRNPCRHSFLFELDRCRYKTLSKKRRNVLIVLKFVFDAIA